MAMNLRSSSEEIANVSSVLKSLTLSELFYVLQENSTLSLFDVNRIKRITDNMRYRYGGDHTYEQVETVIELLGNSYPQTLPMQTEMSLLFMTQRETLGPNILPFTSVCCTCKRSLSKYDANQRFIKIYCANGSVVSGMK